MPIPLGIFATAGAGGAGGSAFELISTQVLASDTASITFSSIPATYKHLQVRAVARDTGAGTRQSMALRLNSDSTSNYRTHALYGNGSSVASFAFSQATSITVESVAAASSGASIWGAAVIDILDYSVSTKNKTTRCLNGIASASNWVELSSGLWMNTAAVTALSLTAGQTSFATGSRFSLYGVRG